MKKMRFLLVFGLIFISLITRTYAMTIRETMDDSDNYSTLESGSVIIGVTKFSPDRVVTASRAAQAGVDDVKLYLSKNGNVDGYESPGVYYYIDSYVGWFFLDNENVATYIDDEEELEKLSKLDIYYVDNVEKILEVDVSNIDVDEDSIPKGVKYEDNKLFVNATINDFNIKTADNKEISFVIDPITSQYVVENKICYTIKDEIITSYNSECGNEIVIPLEYNGDKITGIADNAFKNTGLVSVVISNEIVLIGNNAFADNNNLLSVLILGKSSSDDFEFFGDNVFGNFNKVIYEKRVEVDNVTLNSSNLNLIVGDSETLIATINPNDATDKDIVWTSSDTNVVTVNNGELTAIGEGSAIITASVGGKSVECVVTVNKKIIYTYEWEKISLSVVDEHYLYIVNSDGNKVSGRVNIKYNNDKNKEFDVSKEGIKIVKSAVSSVEIINVN